LEQPSSKKEHFPHTVNTHEKKFVKHIFQVK